MKTSKLFLIIFSTFALLGTVAEAAKPKVTHTWPKRNACMYYVDLETDSTKPGHTKKIGRYSCMAVDAEASTEDFADVNAVVSELIGKPGTISTPEFVMYYMGSVAFGAPAEYYTDSEMQNDNGTEEEMNAKIAQMLQDPWITLIHPLKADSEEDGCLTVGRTASGKAYGCGDVWQGGITEDKLACSGGVTYIRCQIECYRKFRDPKVQFTQGSCPKK